MAKSAAATRARPAAPRPPLRPRVGSEPTKTPAPTPRWHRLLPAVVVAAACLFAFVQLQPGQLLADTTPTGGDLGGHVWGPAFLRDHLWDHGLFSGWAADWFGGFPAYRFYMPLPAILVIGLDALLPSGVALKLVVALPIVALPAAAAFWARRAAMVGSSAAIVGVFSLVFLFDDSYFRSGGNAASTIVGEYGNALGLVVGLVAVALFQRDLERGRSGVAAPVVGAFAALCHPIGLLFVLVGFASSAGAWLPIRQHAAGLSLARALGVIAVLSAFWYLPLVWYQGSFNDLAFIRVTSVRTLLFPQPLVVELIVMALAVFGTTVAWSTRRRAVIALAATGGCFALAALIAPRGILWNARLAPPWHLCRVLLAGVGLGLAIEQLGTRVPRDRQTLARFAAPFAALALVTIPLSWDLGTLPFSDNTSERIGQLDLVTETKWLVGPAHTPNRVTQFATFGFGGYERGPEWASYEELLDTMTDVSGEQGCGRAMAEFDPSGKFGSTYATALLPYWTDGCVASIGGLYSDSSPTSSFVFVAESAVSPTFSAYEPGLPYEGVNLGRGVAYMRELGVTYFIAHSEEVREFARGTDGLVSLASTTSWEVFRVDGVNLVEPLKQTPVVLNKAGDRDDWQDVALQWFTQADPALARISSDGPQAWPIFESLNVGVVRDYEAIAVTDVVDDGDSISFHVDKIGVPVLVRASYFPTWRAEGADGPWRTAPNWMIVVPTENDVRLSVGAGGVETFASVVTLVGIVLVVALVALPPMRRRLGGSSRRPAIDLSA